VVDKERKSKKTKTEVVEADHKSQWGPDTKDLDPWFDADGTAEFDSEVDHVVIPPPPPVPDAYNRLERIKESHGLLRQFTPKELKILLNLTRNTSPKAWTLREDLIVLTLQSSNREIAELLKDRNKEAVKKRLQLLKSKGLTKRPPDPGANPS